MRMTLADVSYDRSKPGRSVGLYLTSRCPVGCAHCSVDSLADSPTIADYNLFADIVTELKCRPGLHSVGISGGEPFVERRGLTLAVDEFSAAGKGIALFTSGVWAKSVHIPPWICSTLRKVSCVFLSTDAYHAAQLDSEVFIRAIQTVANESVWLIVQVLRSDVAPATQLLQKALGKNWEQNAEISLISPLPYGRGESLFSLQESWPANVFGKCSLSVSPLVRYDGMVAGCCNEEVIVGKGPQRLRHDCNSVGQIASSIEGYITDPLMRALHTLGAGSIAQHPRYKGLKERQFNSICQLCWEMQDLTPQHDTDAILVAAALMGEADVDLA